MVCKHENKKIVTPDYSHDFTFGPAVETLLACVGYGVMAACVGLGGMAACVGHGDMGHHMAACGWHGGIMPLSAPRYQAIAVLCKPTGFLAANEGSSPPVFKALKDCQFRNTF